ncbi:MAG: zinc ribbon domain-containing protein [Candidatus Altiarchaeota archaeon]|nr:zinc ribbon domain-containing protein [Candidatus Altiarchaeota archaeon]
MPDSVSHKRVFTIFTASILYALFSFLFIIGPLVIGFYLGGRVKSPREGFLFALTTAVAGFSIQHYIILQGLYGKFIITLSIILWQVISTICLLVGVFAGYIYSGFGRKVVEVRRRKDEREINKPRDYDAPKTYIVCPVCGESNKEDARICKSCGSKI